MARSNGWQDVARNLSDNYADAKRNAGAAEEHYRIALADYEIAQANIVLAVDAARDGTGKPLYSNEKTRSAEVTLRLSHDLASVNLANASRTFRMCEVEAKVAGMAARLWMASVYRTQEDDSDVHEAD